MPNVDTEVRKKLVAAISRADAIIFVGAGLGFDATPPLPSWPNLISQFIDYCNGLGKNTALARKYYEENNLYDAAGVLKDCIAPHEFSEFMISVGFAAAEPHVGHEIIMSFPSKKFMTPNYDMLIEKSYTLASGKPFDEGFVITNSELAERAGAITQGHQDSFLYKYHGCIQDPDTIILSYEEYEGIINSSESVQMVLQSIFTTKPIIMIGFSVDDKDFNKLISKIHALAPESLDVYAFMGYESLGPASKVEIKRFRETRGINLIPYPAPNHDHTALLSLLKDFSDEIQYNNRPITVNVAGLNEGALEDAIRGANEHWNEVDKKILGHVEVASILKKENLHNHVKVEGFDANSIRDRADFLVRAGILLETENTYITVGDSAAREAAIYIEDELIQMLEGL